MDNKILLNSILFENENLNNKGFEEEKQENQKRVFEILTFIAEDFLKLQSFILNITSESREKEDVLLTLNKDAQIRSDKIFRNFREFESALRTLSKRIMFDDSNQLDDLVFYLTKVSKGLKTSFSSLDNDLSYKDGYASKAEKRILKEIYTEIKRIYSHIEIYHTDHDEIIKHYVIHDFLNDKQNTINKIRNFFEEARQDLSKINSYYNNIFTLKNQPYVLVSKEGAKQIKNLYDYMNLYLKKVNFGINNNFLPEEKYYAVLDFSKEVTTRLNNFTYGDEKTTVGADVNAVIDYIMGPVKTDGIINKSFLDEVEKKLKIIIPLIQIAPDIKEYY